MRMCFSRILFLALPAFASVGVSAPVSQVQNIDFYRDVPSRNLQGLATRSDGRLFAGPVLQALTGELGVDLVWDLEPWPDGRSDRWLVGTGPEGKILAVTVDATAHHATAEVWSTLPAGHVFVVRALSADRVVVGTSPHGRLYVLADTGEIVASVQLPADSIFDVLSSPDGRTLWVATGNPGRVFEIDRMRLEETAATGLDAPWAERGVKEFGAVRDRNLRRLARAADGALLAGSAPSGNLYRFAPAGGAPTILFDNERAEVTDILVQPNGDVYATVVFSPTTTTNRVANAPKSPPKSEAAESDGPNESATTIMEATAVDPFAGRTALIYLPHCDGLPETVAARNNLAAYRIVPRGPVLLLPGGDSGELAGYDTVARRSLTFAGSSAAQLTDLVAMDDTAQRYLVLTNNPVGLTQVDFAAHGPRSAKTRKLDLRVPGELGAVRFNRTRAVVDPDIAVLVRTNRSRDDVEGWTPWTSTTLEAGGWKPVQRLLGQYVELQLTLPPSVAEDLQIDAAGLYFAPQNRRPVLQSFRIVSPNYALIPRSDGGGGAAALTLSQVIGNDSGGAGDTARSSASFLSSPVVPQLGAQIVTWNVRDADNDRLAATFSVRHEEDATWTDLILDTTENWFQFDRRTLREGTYFTRLTVAEQSPRAPADRRTITFDTDDLVIDLTPPIIREVTQRASGKGLCLVITGVDERSLLAGIELIFNNGYHEEFAQTQDGILDSLTEAFEAVVPRTTLTGATTVEIYISDIAGNVAVRRENLIPFD